MIKKISSFIALVIVVFCTCCNRVLAAQDEIEKEISAIYAQQFKQFEEEATEAYKEEHRQDSLLKSTKILKYQYQKNSIMKM